MLLILCTVYSAIGILEAAIQRKAISHQAPGLALGLYIAMAIILEMKLVHNFHLSVR